MSNEKKSDRFKNLAKKNTHVEYGGDVIKASLITETESNTFTNTLSSGSVDVSIPEPKVKFEKLRKRSTFWLREDEIKIVNKMAKKLKRPKYEILENAIKLYAEVVENERKII